MSVIVSVIMPVYNGARYLMEAVNSILIQTLPDFELIILDDKSTDDSRAVMEAAARQDKRIRLIFHEKNLGLPGTLKHGLELANGEYFARMDQDDISRPERLEKQVKYLQDHLEIGICGTWAEIIGDRAGEIWKYPTGHDEIYARMLFANTLVHPSVMLRASALRQADLTYDVGAVHIEDYDLWSRALPLLKFANLPEPLLCYRLHGANTGDLHGDQQRSRRALIYARFAEQLQLTFTSDELVLHEQIGFYQYQQADLNFLQNARHWLEKIISANRLARLIAPEKLEHELGLRWTQICHHSAARPSAVCFEIFSSALPFCERTGIEKYWRAIKFFLGKVRFTKML